MARGRQSALRLVLSPEERQPLERGPRSTPIAAGRARRGRILLMGAAGHAQPHGAPAVGVQRTVVRTWARRFLAQRRDGRAHAPGRGAKGVLSPRRREPRGAARLCASRDAGPQPCPRGWHRTRAPAHRGGAGGGPLRGDRAADAGQPAAHTLAPPSRAGSPAPPGRRLLCDRRCTHRSLHAPTA
jgi:hypothetical protein